MDASQWPQGMGLVKPMEEFVIASSITTTATSTATASTTGAPVVERRPKPPKEQALNCPRCNSTNTKFCYYNNYSLTQPRYLCKTCRRYWTEGGSLRNVPVGGGSRKNKRSSSFSSPIPSSTAAGAVANASNPKEYLHPDNHLMPPYKMPKLHGGEDLNLAFPQHGLPEYNSYPSNAAVGALSANGMLNRPFFPLPEYATGFGIAQEFRPTTLNFPLDHGIVGGSAGGNGGGSASKMLFPMEELKTLVPVSNNSEQFEQSKAQGGGNPPGYWNGISW